MKKKYAVAVIILLGLITARIFSLTGRMDIFSHYHNPSMACEELERLKTLPYLNWDTIENGEENKSGVVKHEPGLAYDGYNLYTSEPRGRAYLIDMRGNMVYEWGEPSKKGWKTAYLNEDGSLFYIKTNTLMGKVDRNSVRTWVRRCRFDHSIDVAENGDIVSVINQHGQVTYKDRTIPVLNNYIVVLAPGGKIKKRVSLIRMMLRDIPAHVMDGIAEVYDPDNPPAKIGVNSIYDVFHTNAAKIIRRDVPVLCAKGDILISVRNLSTIAIVRIDETRVIWKWGRHNLLYQHDPTLLDNGNILIFDNQIEMTGSRVIEVNPLTKKIEWEYTGSPPKSFFSRTRGAAQKLPNGNVLIIESDKGHAFEVTPGGRIVWDFYNPDIADKDGESRRATIYKMTRIDKNDCAGFLSR